MANTVDPNFDLVQSVAATNAKESANQQATLNAAPKPTQKSSQESAFGDVGKIIGGVAKIFGL